MRLAARRATASNLAGLLWVFSGTAAASADGTNNMLEEFRWKNRPVIAFVPDANNALLHEQERMFAAERACTSERDMLLIEVAGTDVWIGAEKRPDLNAAALRTRFSVAPDETAFVLIGKDGGAKLRSNTPFSANTLFGTIDAMPMRAREARERRSGVC